MIGRIAWFVTLMALAPPATSVAAQGSPMLHRSVRELEEQARADSNDGALQYYLALAHWKRHHWKQTDSLLRLAIQLEPRFAEAYLALYHLPFSRRSSLAREVAQRRVPRDWQPVVEEAEGFYQLAFRINPLMSQEVLTIALDMRESRFATYTWYSTWFVDLAMGRYSDAHSRLERIAQARFQEDSFPERVPDFILWHRALAAAHAGRYFNALRDLQTLVDRGSRAEEEELVHIPLRTNEYRFMLAVVHQRAGNPDRAMDLFREAVEHDLGLAMAHSYMAGLYQEAGQLDSSFAERQRAVEVSPDDPSALFEYAVSLFNARRLAEAEEALRRAVALNPRYSPPLYLLGRAAEELGRPADARELYQRFLSLAPRRQVDLRADAERFLTAVRQQ